MADTQVLTTVKGGINRLRTKGAALKDSLYDLVNGYVTEEKTVVVRPGTFRTANLATPPDGSGRSFVAGSDFNSEYNMTLTGWWSAEAPILPPTTPQVPIGSVDTGSSSYAGFPILGIFYFDDTGENNFVRILFGPNSEDVLPTTEDLTGVTLTINGVVSELFDAYLPPNTDIAGYAFVDFTFGVSPIVDEGEYVFSFDPEDVPSGEDTPGITKGLVAFENGLSVFAHEAVAVPDGFTLHILSHPDATAEDPIAIEAIEFAAPFLGYLYVVATFENGDTYHFWLQSGDEWQPDTIYRAGAIVVPSTSTGLAYQATRAGDPNPSWQANISRAIGDIIEPTVYNDYQYTVVDVQGDNPRSGTTEPTWPTEDGAQVFEDADGSSDDPPTITQPPDNSAVPSPGIRDRYSNFFRNR